MSLKFLLIFLSTFLLVQNALGKALPSTEESKTIQSDLSGESAPPSVQLAFYVVMKISQLSDIALNTGKKLFQDVIADISATDNKNEEITAKLEEYTQFLSKIEKLQSEDESEKLLIDKFNLMQELGSLLSNSSSKVTLTEKPNSIEKLFEESIKKNGLSNFEKQFEEKFETFAKDFNETVERVMNSVTIEECPEKTKILDWLKNFKIESNMEKRVAMLDEFLGLF